MLFVRPLPDTLFQLAPLIPALPAAGADAFFPVFLFVVIRSRMPHLAANVEYVKRFRLHSRLTGQFDYMLCNLVRQLAGSEQGKKGGREPLRDPAHQ